MQKEVLKSKSGDVFIKIIRPDREDIYINVCDIANPGWVNKDTTANGYEQRIKYTYYTKSNEGFSISSYWVPKGDSSLEKTLKDYKSIKELVLKLMFEGNPVGQQLNNKKPWWKNLTFGKVMLAKGTSYI